MSKICKVCGVDRKEEDYYISNKKLGKRSNECKECTKVRVNKRRLENIDYVKEYDRNRPNSEKRNEENKQRYKDKVQSGDLDFKERDRKRLQDNRAKHPEKYKANCAVGNAVRDNKLTRPNICSDCLCKCKPQGHHWSYLEEHWLDVIWLCVVCHAKEHTRLREIERNNK